MSTKRYWTGTVPPACQITGIPFNGVMYDARIPGRGWGNICQEAFDTFHCRLGVGFGQKYELQDDGRWLCTAGSSIHAVTLSEADRYQIAAEANARKSK